MENKLPPDDIQKALTALVDYFDNEDRAVREWQIRKWRKYKLYWEGFQRLWMDSEVAHDWRVFDAEKEADTSDAAFYDKQVNIYRALLESIIAALSVTVPAIKCAPDDADNILDVQTARAGEKIAALIFKHNNAPLLWLHSLFTMVTEGMTACYSYPKEDEKYGTYTENKYEEKNEGDRYFCPNCRENLGEDLSYFSSAPSMMQQPPMMEEQPALSGMEQDMGGSEMMEPEMDMSLMDQELMGQEDLMQDEFQPYTCPECGHGFDELQKEPLIVTRIVGVTTKPKTRICQEIYGGLYVKVPNYARKQSDIPYLGFSYECHISEVYARYEHIREKYTNDGKKVTGNAAGMYEPYERWGRLSPQYRGEYPLNTPTVRNFWFRPWAYNVLCKEDSDKLKEHYPDGVKTVHINHDFAEAIPEVLDDCWTLTYNPLADNIHFEPLAHGLVSLQDITNDLVSLILQTIEHGIPQTFADPDFVNFKAYKAMEALPGAIIPTKTLRGNKKVSDGFYEVKTATLSQEVMPFGQQVQNYAQLVSGALPSLFGGGNVEGSKTASEYSMSRAQALQRLQNTWKILLYWWKEIFGKCIPAYMKEIVEDERYVKRDDNGNYINVFIRKAELEGKIGEIELEATEQLPLTWGQKKDAIMKLLELNNPALLEALSAPENLPLLKDAVGVSEFVMPGEADRDKQWEEIKLLLNSEPITLPPDPMVMLEAVAQGQDPTQIPPTELPSIEVDMDLDNHAIEAEICRGYLVSEAGRLAKIENPEGYKNVLLHMKMHKDAMMQQMMQQVMQQTPPESQPSGNKTNEENKDERVNV